MEAEMDGSKLKMRFRIGLFNVRMLPQLHVALSRMRLPK